MWSVSDSFGLVIQGWGREGWVITSSEPWEQVKTWLPATKSRMGQGKVLGGEMKQGKMLSHFP